ncbi:MAG: cytochrome C biogenesis protein [Bdellovibrionales bacterium RIFOXYC1_FULL_54_43]|nr:MAG: cytochrome C biogenesis protein [Bdellovibrionales bacterium RIFOXYC1_FULL_54_43]OFZ78772.1 MAG: cytochrome C biogenesis protein [Bdellovibrionales bacterium RIFOXYD1_FULL_55_31]
MLMTSLTALWLGILTSLSPCPLATNIAALSYIGGQFAGKRKALLSGFLYLLGRTLSYLALGIILVTSLISVPDVSFFLQKYLNRALGPLLIVIGMFLLDLISIPFSGFGASERLQKKFAGMGVAGALPLGIIFALAFCPVSAALFFGSLIPIAVREQAAIRLPIFYGIGTALPVVAFALLFAFGADAVTKAFRKVTAAETWARRITGILFVTIGLYYSLVYIFRVL